LRVIGIDPGLRRTGWGLVESEGNRLRHIANGVIATDEKNALPERLMSLQLALTRIVEDFRPEAAAVEETLANLNRASTLKLGMARAVALLVPAVAGLPVAQYLPMVVKKAVVGTGHADKNQVASMVQRLLPGATATSVDASDALAVAICHCHHQATRSSWLRGSEEAGGMRAGRGGARS